MVVLVVLAVVSIAFVLFAKRYKIWLWFKRRVKMLSTVCEKSPDDSHIMPEEKFTESFDSANFFVQYKPETKEFFFSSYYYLIFLITSRLGARRLRMSKHLSPRKRLKQKSK